MCACTGPEGLCSASRLQPSDAGSTESRPLEGKRSEAPGRGVGGPRLVEETLEEASCEAEFRLYGHQFRARSWLALPHAMLVCPFADVSPCPHVPCPGQHKPSASSLSRAGFSRCPDWGQCMSCAPITSYLGETGQGRIWR